MATHTPGPWRWDYVLLRGANDAVVVDVSTNPCGPSEEDARLMAAAPELLEACESFARVWEMDIRERAAQMDVALGQARAAIAKAECRLKS